MNENIDTSTRLFMVVVGPSESGRTELIFKLLTERIFYPEFERVLFFYKDNQPVVMDKLNVCEKRRSFTFKPKSNYSKFCLEKS